LSGSANSDDGTGQGDSGAGGGMVLYAEVKAGGIIEGECRPTESGVPGRKDRGDNEEVGEDDDDLV